MNINLLNLTDLYSSKHPGFTIEHNDEIYKKLNLIIPVRIINL